MLTKDLSKLTCVSPARITAVIDSLEKKGYAKRELVEHDRRKIQVTLCEKGRDIMDSHKKEAHERTTDFLRFLGEEDSTTLLRLLDKSIEYFTAKEDKA